MVGGDCHAVLGGQLVEPQDIGTEFIRQVLLESQKVRLAHAKAREGLIKAREGLEGPWRGPYGSCSCTNKRSGKESPGRP